MASELRPVVLLPFAVCALALSLILQTQYRSATAPTKAQPIKASDHWRSPPAFPKPDPAVGAQPGHLVAYIKPGRAVALHSRPNGGVLASLGSHTEFGSARALSVVRERRGRWLGVTTPQLPTDKLPGARYSSVYGCCILALSGTQPNLPRGWTGGNRLAIHGTPEQGSVGGRESAGCLHARDGDLRRLMSAVPLGTPVRIHA